MKRSNGLISALAGLFSVLYIMGIMMGVVLVGIAIARLSGLTDVSENEISFNVVRDIDEIFSSESKHISTDYQLSYSLNGEVKNGITHESAVDEIIINDTSYSGMILGILEMLFAYVISMLFIKQLVNIFRSLEDSIKNKVWFSMANYQAINRIAYLTIGVFLVRGIFQLIYCFMLDDVFVNGVKVYLLPNLDIVETLWTVAIIFVIAHVYKEGVQLREEQELTI